jgi:hypothetical protein
LNFPETKVAVASVAFVVREAPTGVSNVGVLTGLSAPTTALWDVLTFVESAAKATKTGEIFALAESVVMVNDSYAMVLV